MNKNRLLALARKALDESSTEAERATSARMLAREFVKCAAGDPSDSLEEFMNADARDAAQRSHNVVQAAVQKDEIRRNAPESTVTWVEFDPPQKPQRHR